MSYDVTFEVPGDHVDGWRNYTSNVSPMWTKAMGANLGDLIDQWGYRCANLLPHLRLGIAVMKAYPEPFKAMNPSNGWGDYDGALGYLEWMAAMCCEWPDVKVTVWR